MLPASWRRWRSTAALAAALAALALAAGGCGADGDGEGGAAAPGPAPPGGDAIASSATIVPGDPYSNVATATADVRGAHEVLIVGLAVIERGKPKLRLTVDGDPARGTHTRLFEGPGGRLAAIFCECEGGGDVRLQARSARRARLGARSLVVFGAAAPEEPAKALAGANVVDEVVEVEPSGSRIAAARLRDDAGSVLVMAAYRSPAASSASPTPIRTEARFDGTALPEVASATIPHGELTVFYADRAASAGDTVELLGFLTAGSARVRAATLVVCACGLTG